MQEIISADQIGFADDKSQELQGVKIARISTVPFFVVSQLKHQLLLLAASGAQVSVVTSDDPELDILKKLPELKCVPMDIPRSIAPWRDFWALVQLWRFFKHERVLIAHSTTPKAGLLTAIAAYGAGVPIRLHTFTGQPWVSMHGVKHWLAKGCDWLVGKLNTHCYADSRSQRAFLIAQRVVADKDISVIGAGSLAGVDISRFDPGRFSGDDNRMLRQQLEIPEGVPVLLFVGRITVDKGVRELLTAFAELKMTDSGAHLIFVGRFDSDSGVTGDISRGDIENIQDIHLIEYTDCPEKYLSIADILCLPSYREGFGTVVIEAAAMGVPTIGTNIYGLSDAIVDTETGMLVAPRDAKALAKALELLISDHELRTNMGRNALSRVKRCFDGQKINQLVIEEYMALLSALHAKSVSTD